MTHIGQLLFGTIRRAQVTSVVLLLAFAFFRPDIIQTAVSNLFGAIFIAINPFIPPILTLIIMGFGFRILWRGVRGKPPAKGK
jgi:hypothetical protein